MNEKKKRVAVLILLFLVLVVAVIGIILGLRKDKATSLKDDGIYKITILKSAHGSVTSNKTEAKEGEEVVLKVVPDEGYELSSLTVNRKESKTTFKMPAEDVRVLAKFSQTDASAYGEFFGKSGEFSSSDVIDFSTDSGEEPYLVLDTTMGTPLYAYINDLSAQQFFFETEVEVTGILENEKFPKFGMMTNDGTEMVKFYLDMNTEKNVSFVGTVHQAAGKEDDWANQDSFHLDNKLSLSNKTVKIGLLRNEKTYYLYVNDKLVSMGKDLTELPSAAGIFSFGTSLKLTDYRLVESGEKFDKLLSAAKKDARAFNSFKLTTNYFKETSKGVYQLKTDSADESKVDDVKYAGQILKAPYYSVKGKLTLKNSEDWSQARILISSDPKNEYVIALEQTAKNKCQIFTMSKNNEEVWNNWTSIVGAEINGNRSSIDFEVIADGNKVYFLIDNMICYTSDSVAMKESTLKFAGYKNATTVVENLNGQIFASSANVKKYIASKDEKSFWAYGLTTNYFKETKDGVYTFKATSNDESKVDDVVYGGNIMRESYYSVKGKLSLKNAKDWSQARILISSDPKNEYVIALEQTDAKLYQIFTMSKDNEEIWNNWTSIVDAEVNEDRDSIDFEVIVDGDKIYFLIDNMIYYTADSVAMKESTVKIAGYGNATVTVENIDGHIFARQIDVQNYLKSKTRKNFNGENFGVTVGDGITYLTTGGINLEKDRGQNPTIDMYQGAPRYAYLKDTFTDKVYFETQISVSKILNDDAYPKFGIILNGKTESLKFFVDMSAEMNASAVGVVHQPTDGDDDWANAKTSNVDNMKFTDGDKVKLAVVRDGKAYYFYVNDKLVLVEDYAFADEKTAVGIFSFNAVLKASDYKVYTGGKADSYIAQAKADAKFTVSTYHFVETEDDVYQLTTSTQDEGKVDNVERAGKTVRAAYYRMKGNISLTNAAAWGQARILISSDAKNEHVISLEKTDKNIYQIFTMSKKNEEIWQNWTAIIDAEVNGNKNSIDFEVIADGNKVYFLINDMIYYTSERVSMEESTVKFASYGNATTTVKNLDGYIFETQEEVQDYLKTKTVKEFKGENFGETVGDGVTYRTMDGINLETDKGENPTIDIYKGSTRYAYLNDTYSDKLYFEIKINVSEVLNDDNWPKFGIILNGTKESLKFYVNMTKEKTATKVGVVYRPTNGGDDWANAVSANVNYMKFTGDEKVKLAVVRDGAAYYFYVNDVLVLTKENAFTGGKSAVGIFSFNTVLNASNYMILQDEKAAEKIEDARNDANTKDALLSVSQVNLEVGEEAYIGNRASVASNVTLDWNSDNTNVAVVEDGFIKAVGAGSANVIVKASNNTNAVCTVNISAASIEPLKLNYVSKCLTVGETITLGSVNGDNRTVTFSSSDTTILEVTNAGIVSGVKSGYAQIIATDNYGNKDECYVLVTDNNSEFVVDGDISEWLVAGTGKYQGYTFTDVDGTNRAVTVYSVLRKDGIYIAGEGNHTFMSEGFSTWFWNTNFEVFVTRGTTTEQKWVNHNNNSSNVVASLNTVENTGSYRSTFEMFIPFEQTEMTEDSYARIGWAFKNKGDALTVKRTDTTAQKNPDWWWPDSHKPDDMNEHWFVYQDGMYEAEKPEPLPEGVIYRQNFDKVKNGALPRDWKFSLGISETAEVVDGKLHIASTKKSQRSGVILDFVPEVDDYAVEFDMTFVSAKGTGKWAGLIFDYCNETEYFPYWQAVLGSNGNINVDRRTASNTYDPVNAITTEKGELSYNTPMHVRIEIDEQVVTYYIDGIQYAQVTLSVARNSGAKLGLTCRGCDVYFDNFEIQELVAEKPEQLPEGVIYRQNFDKVENGTLPSDWKFSLGISETAEVVDGKLHIASTKKSQRSGVILDFVPEVDDYAVEFDMTLVSAKGTGKWAGLIFDYCNETEYFPYWQAVLGSNGNINVDRRTASNKYDPVNAITTGKGELSCNTPMHVRIEIDEQVVTYYIDGIQYAQVTLGVARNSGAKLGLTCRGCDVYFENFEIRELVYYKQNFDSVVDGSLPSDWVHEINAGSGTVEVSEGRLYVNGYDAKKDLGVICNYVPTEENYAVEFDMTFQEARNDKRWTGLVFDYVSKTNYWQAVVRKNGNINIDRYTGSFTSNPFTTEIGTLSLPKTMHVRIELRDNMVTYYIDGTRYAQLEMSVARNKNGLLGLACSQSKVYYDNFKIKALEVK